MLPGWSRAHVVAHLSRNADAFRRVLAAAGAGEPAHMYASDADRDAEIEETVRSHDLAALVEDAITSSARLTEAMWACDADPATPYTRTPGGEQSWPLDTLGPRRRAEVEIHHADLDTGYLPAEWPPDFSRQMVRQRHQEMAALPEAPRPWCSPPPTTTGSGSSAPGRGRRSAAASPTWPGGCWAAAAARATCATGDLPVLDDGADPSDRSDPSDPDRDERDVLHRQGPPRRAPRRPRARPS